MSQAATPRAISGQDRIALHRQKQDSGEKNKPHCPLLLLFLMICLKESGLSLLLSSFSTTLARKKTLPKVYTIMYRFTNQCALCPSSPEASEPTSTNRSPPVPPCPGMLKEAQQNVYLPKSCLITHKSKHLPTTSGSGSQGNSSGEQAGFGFGLKKVFMMFASNHEISLQTND